MHATYRQATTAVTRPPTEPTKHASSSTPMFSLRMVSLKASTAPSTTRLGRPPTRQIEAKRAGATATPSRAPTATPSRTLPIHPLPHPRIAHPAPSSKTPASRRMITTRPRAGRPISMARFWDPRPPVAQTAAAVKRLRWNLPREARSPYLRH